MTVSNLVRSSLAIAAVGLASLTPASAQFFANATGLASPAAVVTFSELSFPTNTLITNQFAAFGVTTSGHRYNPQGQVSFPGTSGDNIGVSTTVPFVLSFGGAVNGAAFGYAKNPTTVFVEALLGGNVVASANQAVTFNNPNTAFLGFSGIVLDSIRLTANTNEGIVDNVQIGTSAVPEPGSLALFAGASVCGFALIRRRK